MKTIGNIEKKKAFENMKKMIKKVKIKMMQDKFKKEEEEKKSRQL